MYKTSSDGIDLIKSFEGLELDAYADPIGIPTIGYGTIKYPDGSKVELGDSCTEDEAVEYLTHDLVTFENAVNKLVKVDINQKIFDALVCFTYNLGETNLKSSTLLKLLNAKKYSEVVPQFLRWNKAGGKVLKGLTRRRQAESDLFAEGVAEL